MIEIGYMVGFFKRNIKFLLLVFIVITIFYSIIVLAPMIAAMNAASYLSGGLVPDAKTAFANAFMTAIGIDENPFVEELTIEDVVLKQEEKKEADVKANQNKPPEMIANGKEIIFPTGKFPPNTWDRGLIGKQRQYIDKPEILPHVVNREGTFSNMLVPVHRLWTVRNSILLALEKYPNTNYGKEPDSIMTINIPPYGDCFVGMVSDVITSDTGDIIEIKSNSKEKPVIYVLCVDSKSMSHTVGNIGGNNVAQGPLGHAYIRQSGIQPNPLEVIMTTGLQDNAVTTKNGGWLKQRDWRVISMKRVGHIKGMGYGDRIKLGESNPVVIKLINKWNGK